MEVSDVGEDSQPIILRPYHSRLQRRSYSFGDCPIQETLEEGSHQIPRALDLESGTVENEVVTVSRVPQLLVRASRNSFQHTTRPRTTIRTIQLQRHYLEDTVSVVVEEDDIDGVVEPEELLEHTGEMQWDDDPQLEGKYHSEEVLMAYGSLGLTVWKSAKCLPGFPALSSGRELLYRLVQFACSTSQPRSLICLLPRLEELAELVAMPNILSIGENTLIKVLLDLHESELMRTSFPCRNTYLEVFAPVALRFYGSREFDRGQVARVKRALGERSRIVLKATKEAYLKFYQKRMMDVSRKLAGYSPELLTI